MRRNSHTLVADLRLKVFTDDLADIVRLVSLLSRHVRIDGRRVGTTRDALARRARVLLANVVANSIHLLAHAACVEPAVRQRPRVVVVDPRCGDLCEKFRQRSPGVERGKTRIILSGVLKGVAVVETAINAVRGLVHKHAVAAVSKENNKVITGTGPGMDLPVTLQSVKGKYVSDVASERWWKTAKAGDHLIHAELGVGAVADGPWRLIGAVWV